MASVLFDEILTKGIRAGQIPARTTSAREWYRNTAKGWGRVNERRLINSDVTRVSEVVKPGQMYMYMYDPKHKDTLPFYDRFPLIFPFKVASDRFWGINLHYLPLPLRAKLMDALYDTVSNTRYDESTKLKISYDILNKAAKFKYFKPCIKEYLFSHMQTKFMYIYPSEWDIALFLPLERFSKASKSTVWASSKKLIAG